MFCDACGAQLQTGQRFCGSCGRPVGASGAATAPQGRVGRHLQVLAVLWVAASALNLVGAGALFLIGNTIFGRFGPAPPPGWTMPESFLHVLFSALAGLVLVKSLLGFAAAWGLFQRESWARTLALVLGFVSLINIPLGTALGIYTIWVLMSPEAGEQYRRLSRAV